MHVQIYGAPIESVGYIILWFPVIPAVNMYIRMKCVIEAEDPIVMLAHE